MSEARDRDAFNNAQCPEFFAGWQCIREPGHNGEHRSRAVGPGMITNARPVVSVPEPVTYISAERDIDQWAKQVARAADRQYWLALSNATGLNLDTVVDPRLETGQPGDPVRLVVTLTEDTLIRIRDDAHHRLGISDDHTQSDDE